MKEISDTIKKLSPEKLKQLSVELKLKKSSTKNIVSTMLTVKGMDTLLSGFDNDDLQLLKVIYTQKEGITFGELEKKLHISIAQIENIAAKLSDRLLIYVIKNRQLLNNKLDKVYGISELQPVLHLSDSSAIREQLKKNSDYMRENISERDTLKSIRDEKTVKLLKYICESGCIIRLEEAYDKLPAQTFNRTINSLVDSNRLYIYHDTTSEFKTYLMLSEKTASSAAHMISRSKTDRNVQVNNGYFFILNLLYTYDVISTYGLFLTKQMEFRKIDRRRISDSMLDIYDISRKKISPDRISDLALFVLHMIGSLKLHKDVANISLAGLHKEIEKPHRLLLRILKSLSDYSMDDSIFTPDFEIPVFRDIMTILQLLYERGDQSCTYNRIILLSLMLSTSDRKSIDDTLNYRENTINTIRRTLNFLCIMGIIEVSSGKLSLSDIGKKIAGQLLKLNYNQETPEEVKCVYINPDFTLIIPVRELPSLSLYYLLTHTDIVKNDVILHAIISKSSVVKAYKRGMSQRCFLETLREYSKNELPQNLTFLLNEWSNQTVKIDISRAIVLKSSLTSFIDEICYGPTKDGIIEKISPNHVIISREFIDDIIKLARKKDAIITLFEDYVDED